MIAIELLEASRVWDDVIVPHVIAEYQRIAVENPGRIAEFERRTANLEGAAYDYELRKLLGALGPDEKLR
jgi:hypothetical protein